MILIIPKLNLDNFSDEEKAGTVDNRMFFIGQAMDSFYETIYNSPLLNQKLLSSDFESLPKIFNAYDTTFPKILDPIDDLANEAEIHLSDYSLAATIIAIKHELLRIYNFLFPNTLSPDLVIIDNNNSTNENVLQHCYGELLCHLRTMKSDLKHFKKWRGLMLKTIDNNPNTAQYLATHEHYQNCGESSLHSIIHYLKYTLKEPLQCFSVPLSLLDRKLTTYKQNIELI